ncbi:MAG: glycosyltransferase [Bacteroidales bacterium]|nr:glycosyltransferase [Bacteroidales bacterium]
MRLTVIIVNYNVEHFLEQCLLSVEKSCRGIENEIIVVDNNSVDGSVDMLKKRFPDVLLLCNKENTGYSKANNQALRIAKGEYCLLLNPDTVVEEDTFKKCLDFMDNHRDCGGLGVKMVDGKGKFLPESKRSLPTPSVAFYKIFGLSKLFPTSKTFGRYHLGFLDKNKTHQVDVLSGACMMLRKEALDKTGLLDEDFFMYGEDIDLSHRIIKAGYKNYYFPSARIIHYKGESTKKGSLNYVYLFYKAMVVFAKKHFSDKNAKAFTLLINTAIFFRALLSVFKRFLAGIFFLLIDATVIFAGFLLIANYWETHVKAMDGISYPKELFQIFLPAYIIIWIISLYFSGAYDRPAKTSRVFQGITLGTVFILIGYALLPESMRYSRALIVLGAIWSILSLYFYRILISYAGVKRFSTKTDSPKRIAIAGKSREAERVADIVRKTHPDTGFIGLINDENDNNDNPNVIGTWNQLKDIIHIYRINEVIFCSKDVDANNIIDLMTSGLPENVDFKIAPPESHFLIGSNSIHTADELYLYNVNAINAPSNKRNKRFLDIVSAVFLLMFSPIIIWFIKHKKGFLINCWLVFTGKKSWVGYDNTQSSITPQKLPGIRPGILHPVDAVDTNLRTNDVAQRLNLLYAREYRVTMDMRIMAKNFKQLGRLSKV